MQAVLGRKRERGIALLSVVAVLVLLAIIATPFLVTMRDGAERGKAVLASTRAAVEAETAFDVTAAWLGQSQDSNERYARDEKLKGQSDTPDFDTPEEFRVPEDLLRNAGLDAESGRIWGVTVEDESSKINVNSAPYTLLGHFFGITRLSQPADESVTELTLESDGGLPAVDGVVRLGDEVVRYERREGTLLRGCQRGFLQDKPGNGPARKHDLNALVVNEVAFQIAAYPVLARRGKVNGVDRTEFAPFQNLYEIRRISDLGVAALTAEQFDRVADYLTVSSRGVLGHVWGDSQVLMEPIQAGEDGHKARLKIENTYRYGIGTTVRVSDGANTDYGVVYGYGGGAYVQIVPALQHDYDASITRVEALLRHPVNVNTAAPEVLTAIHSNIHRHLQTPLTSDTARLVAEQIVKRRIDPEKPGLRGLKDYRDVLAKAVRSNALQAEEATACELNALNPMETASNRLAVGSVPLSFKSGDVFTITARAVVLDPSGKEIGRRSFRRVVDVNPQGTSLFEIAGQADLDEALRVASAKYMTTYPLNLASEDRGAASPPSRYVPFFKSDRWPSTDRTDPVVSVRLMHGRLSFGKANGTFPEPEHFDDSKDADGNVLTDGAVSMSAKDARVAVVADNSAGMEPFSASLWFKPYSAGRTAYVLDGGEAENQDRVSLFYDGDKRELVLRVKDTSIQRTAAEIRYPFDRSSWTDDVWYHLHVSVTGSRPDQMALVVDGVKRGTPSLLTWTTSAVDPTADVTALAVEDASTFPEAGALLLRGPDGVEVMEYTSRSDSGFTISKRFARFSRADTVDGPNGTGTSRSLPAGSCVSLYGYSIPTTSNVPAGSGTLTAAIGKMDVLVLDAQNPPHEWPDPSQGGSPLLKGWRGTTITLNLGSDVHAWGDPGTAGVEAAKAFGNRGYAVLASGDGTYGLYYRKADGNLINERLMDSELVSYEVTGGTMVITRQPKPTKYLDSGAGGGGGGAAPGTAGSGGGLPSTTSSLDKSGSTTMAFIPRHSYGDDADSGMKQFFTLLKSQAARLSLTNGRMYADIDRITEDGLISVLIPISVEVSGDRTAFLDPDADGATQDRFPRSQFVQVGRDRTTEWVKFDAVEQATGVSQNLLLVRDRSAQRATWLFRQITRGSGDLQDPNTPPGGGGGGGGPGTPPPGPGPEPPAPPPPEDDGGGGGGPDVPPAPDPGPPGEDDGPPSGTPDQPPLPPDPGPGEDDGPGGPPDAPPEPDPGPPGEDDGPGGDPDAPPEPDPGPPGEDDGPGGDPDAPPEPDPNPDPTPEPEPEDPPPEDGGPTDSPPTDTVGGGGSTGGAGLGNVPYPIQEIARYLDFRSTDNKQASTDYKQVRIGDLANADALTQGHAAGTQVLACFLVAFPGLEYDPQADGSSVDWDYDSVLTASNGSTGGAAPAGSLGGTGAPTDTGRNPPKTTSPNSSAAAGDTGDDADPGLTNLLGTRIEPGPGEDDEVTLVAPGEDGGVRESAVVNWSYRVNDYNRSGGFRRSWTWVALKEPMDQEFVWSSDRLPGRTRSAMGADVRNYLLHTTDHRLFVRIVKSPSGEMPSRVPDDFRIGAKYDGSAFARAVVDEVRFASPRSASSLVTRKSWYVGPPPEAGAQGEGIGPEDTTLPIHVAPGYSEPTPAEGTRDSGGILRVEDELIGYSEFDSSTQTFSGLERGAFGTEAKFHSYEAPVTPVLGIGVSRLSDAMNESSSRIPLANSSGFPIYGGFVRIGRELLGYTRIGSNSVLEMPQGRHLRKDGTFDPYADTDAAAGLFRARFGSDAASHDAGALVYHFDHRFPDVAREKADNPQMSWYTVSREVHGAVWKRISWDARLRSLVGVRAVIRFEGGPAWDSDKMIRVGTDAIPEVDRNRWLYEITDPRKENLLNVQSDRVEVRVFFTFEKGAWNPEATPAADAWKETPWLQAFRIEYVAPAAVVTTEDLR